MSRKKNPPKSSSIKHEKSPDRTIIYVALIGLFGTILAACIGAVTSIINTRTQILLPISLSQTPIPTKTSIPTYISTPIACGSGTIPVINTPLPINQEPTLVVVTIDEGITWVTLENVLVSLDNSLQIGDRVIILVDGKQKIGDALIMDETITSTLAYPVPPLLPTPLPTTTPTQAQNLTTTFQKAIATATAQAAMIQATQASEQYLCNVYQLDYSYQTAYSQWQVENQESVSRFIGSLREKIQGVAYNNTSPATFEGLIFASNIFSSECRYGNYKNCVFLPLTIMQEWRKEPSDIEVDFSDVDIVGTMTDCQLNDSTCRKKVAYWQSFFTTNNAKSVFFVDLDEFWSLLTDIISK